MCAGLGARVCARVCTKKMAATGQRGAALRDVSDADDKAARRQRGFTEREREEFAPRSPTDRRLEPAWSAWGYWLGGDATRKGHTNLEKLSTHELQHFTDPLFRPLSSLYGQDREVYDYALMGRLIGSVERVRDEGAREALVHARNGRCLRCLFDMDAPRKAIHAVLRAHEDSQGCMSLRGTSELGASILIAMRTLWRLYLLLDNDTDRDRDAFAADFHRDMHQFNIRFADDENEPVDEDDDEMTSDGSAE